MILMIGAISSPNSLIRRGLSLTGPAALPGFRGLFGFNSLSNPFCAMSISGVVESCIGSIGDVRLRRQTTHKVQVLHAHLGEVRK